jgi:hypothetical protein
MYSSITRSQDDALVPASMGGAIVRGVPHGKGVVRPSAVSGGLAGQPAATPHGSAGVPRTLAARPSLGSCWFLAGSWDLPPPFLTIISRCPLFRRLDDTRCRERRPPPLTVPFSAAEPAGIFLRPPACDDFLNGLLERARSTIPPTDTSIQIHHHRGLSALVWTLLHQALFLGGSLL